ncbi:hypothetical protein BVRB_033690, partial [Beta vulgaris subsp. vulgaris]
ASTTVRVCRRFRVLSKTPISELYDGRFPDSELLRRFHEAMNFIAEKAIPAQVFSPQLTVSLYDRLINSEHLTDSEKAEALKLLIETISADLITGLLASNSDLKSEPFLQLFRNYKQQLESPHHIPAEVIKSLHPARIENDTHGFSEEIVSEVRGRYPPPFDLFFPHGPDSCLLDEFPRDSNPLADPSVLLALLYQGVRFNIHDFCNSVSLSADQIPDIIPLLHSQNLDLLDTL